MMCRIRDLDIDIVCIDDRVFFNITVKKVEVMHEVKNVNHHFLFQPLYCNAMIMECQFLSNGFYSYDYLSSVSNYAMCFHSFRECIWCITKALMKERPYNYV